MLGFFRTYQRAFYLVITVVIIISFSFFGTQSTIQENNYRDDTAFTAIDGSSVKRSELEKLLLFIGTDSQDKKWYGPQFGPNFLNNGVIRNQFLKTGLAQIIAEEYLEELKVDLEPRFAKEKKFRPYVHPHAKFLRAEEAWNHFSPTLSTTLKTFTKQSDPSTPEAFDLRVRLYLAEQQFPAPLLQQVLMQQQSQYNWLPADGNLQYSDLSLFGYHTAEDWFGPRFMRLTAQFIINSAKLAEKKGYHIPKDEVIADLMENNQNSYLEIRKYPNFALSNRNEYLRQQLRAMGLDLNQAAKIWKQVMLFQRLYEDIGNSTQTDAMAYTQFHQDISQSVSGESYQLPEELQLGQFAALQQLEMYLRATTPNYRQDQDLKLSTQSLALQEIEKKYPELIQTRYNVEIVSVDKRDLYGRVGVKEAWEWEVQDKNWERLQDVFADLGVTEAKTTEERYAQLEKLPETIRWRVDNFARKAIVGDHPEWLQEAISKGERRQETWGVSLKGDKAPLMGVQNSEQFTKWLSELKENEIATYADEAGIYHQIQITEKTSGKELLTFAEARNNGTLADLVSKELELFYTRVREASPEKYKAPDGSWKELHEIQDQIAERYFTKLLKKVEEEYRAVAPQGKLPSTFTPDFAASVRLYPQVTEIKRSIAKGEELTLGQWSLEKVPFTYDKTTEGKKELFKVAVGEWSPILSSQNGEIAFYQVQEKGTNAQPAELVKKVGQLHQLLSSEAQRDYAKKMIQQLKEKQAISLEYRTAE